ncbi:MAG: OPT/YSL family transporter [Candidatus Firestonebacteria bacterium]
MNNGITFKSIFIGIICIFIGCAFTTLADMRYSMSLSSYFFLPLVIVFLLILMTVVKWVLSIFGIKLTSKELLVIYIMMAMVVGLPSTGIITYILPTVTSPLYYSTVENRWEELIIKHIPEWLMPSDPDPSTTINESAQYFYEGLPKGASIPWASWIKPFLAFFIFSLVLYFIYFCLAIIIRKQWIENERLSFPIVQLPLEMVKGSESSFVSSLFKNKLFWIGCIAVFLLHFYNVLTFFIPDLERIALRNISLNFLFTESPWIGMKGLAISIYFSVIGFSFLLPVDVSFSLWFFYLLNAKFQYVFANVLGFTPTTGGALNPQFLQFEQFGAYLVLVVFSIWYARKHLKEIVKSAFKKSDSRNGHDERLHYKIAFFGLIIGIIVLIFLLSLVGISPIYGFFTVLIFVIIIIVVSRIVAEGGVYFTQQNFAPYGIINSAVGTSSISPQTLTLGGMFNWIYVIDLLALPLPFINDGYKIAHETGINRKKLTFVMVMAAVIGLIVSFYSFLYISYHFGGVNLERWYLRDAPTEIYSTIQSDLTIPKDTKDTKDTESSNRGQFLIFGGLGGVVLVFIMFMRQKFLWWPFHPIGYVMGFSTDGGPMWRLWFSFFVGWLIKSTIVSYLGGSVYKKMKPLFFGFILGEVFIAIIIVILQLIYSRSIYMVFP